MTSSINALLTRPDIADALARDGLQTIRRYHTCANRVDELLQIFDTLNVDDERSEKTKMTRGLAGDSSFRVR
jgi:spore maturation protein CgeB